MNVIYEKIKDLIPIRRCIKYRENGDLLIVSNDESEIFYLNETTKDFYLLCDGTSSFDMILDSMIKIYDVSKNELIADFLGVVRDMQWKKILSLKEIDYEKV